MMFYNFHNDLFSLSIRITKNQLNQIAAIYILMCFLRHIPCQRSHRMSACGQAARSSTASSAGYTPEEPGLGPQWGGTLEGASSPYGWSLVRKPRRSMRQAGFNLKILFTTHRHPSWWIHTLRWETQHAVRWSPHHHLLKDNRKAVHVSLVGAFTRDCKVPQELWSGPKQIWMQ